ncbi:MAG: YcjX family protein, partial [Alphaproteobacteria bacterium]
PFEKNVIKKCSNQIVLADVLQLLQDGVDSYNDARACLNAALESYGYFPKTKWHKLNILKSWVNSNVKQVMFVATKADECSKSSRSNLKFLIKNLVEKKYKGLKFEMPDDKIFFEYCSSHKSTKDKVKNVTGKRIECLEGKLEDSRKNGVFQALNIPNNWPEDLFWEKFIDKNYFLKFLPPRLPKRDGAIIKHINLDRILSTILKPLI